MQKSRTDRFKSLNPPGRSDTQYPSVQYSPAFTFLFIAYIIVSIVGVICLLTAIYPYFNLPHYFKNSENKTEHPDRPTSFLSGPQIAKCPGRIWANAYVAGQKLKLDYVKNYIFESYLVAEKVARKYSRLRIATAAIYLAFIFLIALLVWVKFLPREPGNHAKMKTATQPYQLFVALDADNIRNSRSRYPLCNIIFLYQILGISRK